MCHKFWIACQFENLLKGHNIEMEKYMDFHELNNKQIESGNIY